MPKNNPLTVHLVKITNLRDANRRNRDVADPYVLMELEQNNIGFFQDKDLGTKKSRTIKDERNPIFNETFVFEDVESLKNVELKIRVMDHDAGLDDDKLGRCVIKLDKLDLEATPTHVRRKVDDNIFGTDAYIFLNISHGEEAEDRQAPKLSYVGEAAYEVLRKRHSEFHNELWNVTKGKVIGKLHQTPLEAFPGPPDEYDEGHDDWFPEKMGEILGRTKAWADVLSLGPPDGRFMTSFQTALATIAENAADSNKPVIVRMMFGNLPGMPCNCNGIRDELMKDIPEDANIRLWVGAWRRGASWNHAKIIAVDGRYLHTGGHNLWDPHYLNHDPVHDLSLEMEGNVTFDGHLFANEQWDFVESCQETFWGTFKAKLPDSMPTIAVTRVTVSEWPVGEASSYPPMFRKKKVRKVRRELGRVEGPLVPILTLGRQGNLHHKDRPADDAFMAMLDSSQKVVRLVLQDLGPVCIPNSKIALPGCTWPGGYLSVLGKALWERGVDVEIVLSNPGSIPGGLTPLDANYGNGWTCVDVAAEIIKRIKQNYPDADDGDLRAKVQDNLRICYLRQDRGNQWEDGMTIGLHSKHFIVDDVATYIGSQNLYVCDLAEWGVLIDNEDQTKQCMDEYWTPMWECSYTGEDVDPDEVMDSLDIDRDGGDIDDLDDETKAKMHEAEIANCGVSSASGLYDTEE